MNNASVTVLYAEEDIREAPEKGRKLKTYVALREWSAPELTEDKVGYDRNVAHDTELSITVFSVWKGLMGAFKPSEVYYTDRVLMPHTFRRSQSIRFAIHAFDAVRQGQDVDLRSTLALLMAQAEGDNA